MKKLFFILFLFISLIGCQKEELRTHTSVGEWRLADASLYIKRWGNYPLRRYAYFKEDQTENCVDLNGNCFYLDIIEKYKTKWTLLQDGTFILNDTLVYETQCNAWSMRVYPIENGSSRVYIVDSIADDYMVWLTSEREQALNFYGIYDNYTYYSKLEFIRMK